MRVEAVADSLKEKMLAPSQTGEWKDVLFPGWRKDRNSSVVSRQSVDSGLDENQSELGVLVLSVSLEVLSDLNGLLHEVVEVFWNVWGKSLNHSVSQKTESEAWVGSYHLS